MPTDDYPPPPLLQPATKVAMAIIGGCLLFGCCAGVCLLPSLPRPSSPAVSAPSKPPKDPAADDPYSPDCAIVRAYLKDHYGDVEIVSWGKRTIWNNRELGGHVFLSARFRRKGERHVLRGGFTIDGFNTVSDARIND